MPTDLKEAFQHALDMEINIRDFYLESKDKVTSELARESLRFLADQELKHIDDIRAYLRELEGGEQYDMELAHQETSQTRAIQFFGQYRDVFERNIDSAPDDAKIYRTGLEIEKKGYSYYAEQAEQAEDEKARKFFEFLKQEEIIHYELLEKMSNYLEDPGAWFIEEESWLFEG